MARKRILAATIAAFVLASARAGSSQPVAFDLPHCRMTVQVHKQGMFSFLADEHEIDAPISGGTFDSTAKTVDLTVDATKLRVVDPKLPAQKRASVQANMEGAQVLDVAAHPTISFRSTAIDDADANRWSVTGVLALHGQTHPVTVRVQRIDATHFRGTATIRQTEFWITPIKVAGGAVSVKDEVDVAFDVALVP